MHHLKKHLLLFCTLLCAIATHGQVALDFRTKVYSKPLDYGGKEIDTIYRNLDQDGYYDSLLITSPTVNFDRATFSKDASFDWATFSKDASFDYARFSKDASFEWARFSKDANFEWAKFSKDANFYRTTFSKYANFYRTTFSKDASFEWAIFSKYASFYMATFSQTAMFSNLSLTDSSTLYFGNCRLPNLLDFSYNSTIKNPIDLTDANFDSVQLYEDSTRQWHYINVYKSAIAKIKIDYQHFRFCFYSGNRDALCDIGYSDTLQIGNDKYLKGDTQLTQQLFQNPQFREYLFKVFPYCRYYTSHGFRTTLANKLRQRWWKEDILDIPPPLQDSVIISYIHYCVEHRYFPRRLPDEEIMSIYEKELKIFADEGQQISYQKLDIEYKDFKHGSNILPHIWNCYGYHKEWVFYWAGLFLLFFILVTFCWVGYLNEHVYRLPYFKHEDVRWHKAAARLWYSIVYTSVLFFLFSLKMENFRFGISLGKIFGAIYVVLVYVAGIACIAYMASFVLQR